MEYAEKMTGNPAGELRRRIDAGIDAAGGGSRVFFRADDTGVPSAGFDRLITLFARMRVPLCPAVVPAWITARRWQRIRRRGRPAPELWCWHQHGWRHVNHEREGKKQEFGPSRPQEKALSDLRRGRDRLEEILGDEFFPVFTPPWNRCSTDTLSGLVRLNFRAVSRSEGARPPGPPILPEFPVQVDLHTRKEAGRADAWHAILGELQAGMSRGCCGIMLHHRRMDDRAFELLERLLQMLVQDPRIDVVNFSDLLAGQPAVGSEGRKTNDGRSTVFRML